MRCDPPPGRSQLDRLLPDGEVVTGGTLRIEMLLVECTGEAIAKAVQPSPV
jgi:hypothetical protein